jgi:ATP-dependent DNA helicase DinG
VVDEAHGAEAEARRAFSTTISSESIQSMVRRLASTDAKSNVFLRAQRNADLTSEAKALFDALVSKAAVSGQAFAIAAEELCLRVKDLLFFDDKSRGHGYEYFDLWLDETIRHGETYGGVVSCARSVIETLEKLIKDSRDLVAYFETIEQSSQEQRDIALLALELRELYDAFDNMFFREGINQVRSVRLCRTKNRLNEIFTLQPLDVGTNLTETLYQQTNSVIFTSATLAVDRKFDSFESALGLNSGENTEADAVQVDSSYDFDHNMRIFVPNDMPEPSSPSYLSTLQKFLADIHLAQNGSILTLFTNRKEMERCFDGVNPVMKDANLRLVCQKWGVSVKGLRDDFLRDEHLSLFALKSFWEGFDAPGSTLKGVIIPKLPFGLPTDPLSRERENIDSRAWAHYSLPAAVIDIKQAVGRLIRTSTDRGFVVLADSRLISKYYGKKFLNSLPSRNIAKMPMADIVAEVATGKWGRVERNPHESESLDDNLVQVPDTDEGKSESEQFGSLDREAGWEAGS